MKETFKTWKRFKLSAVNKQRLTSMAKESGSTAIGFYEHDGQEYPIARVTIDGLQTWFICGRPLLTVLKYTDTDIAIQYKLARGSKETGGERRDEFENFVQDITEVLGANSYPVFDTKEGLRDYFNEIECIDNGYHPFAIIK